MYFEVLLASSSQSPFLTKKIFERPNETLVSLELIPSLTIRSHRMKVRVRMQRTIHPTDVTVRPDLGDDASH